MNVSAGATIRNGSFYSDRNLVSATRSNSVTSYPSYAPPTYEVATASAVPNTLPVPEVPETPRAESLRIGSGSSDTDSEPATPRKLFDPLSSNFTQGPASDVSHDPLPQPFVVHARPRNKFLGDAFEVAGTNALEEYGVLAQDWVQMLEDIRAVAQLTRGQRFAARVLPVTMFMGFIGFFVSRAIRKEMIKKNAESVLASLDVWNERFFKPRGLEVILCHGDWQVTGSPAHDEVQLPAPDRPHVLPKQRGYCRSKKFKSQALGQLGETRGQAGFSKCERYGMVSKRGSGEQEQLPRDCSSRKGRYRLVVVSL